MNNLHQDDYTWNEAKKTMTLGAANGVLFCSV